MIQPHEAIYTIDLVQRGNKERRGWRLTQTHVGLMTWRIDHQGGTELIQVGDTGVNREIKILIGERRVVQAEYFTSFLCFKFILFLLIATSARLDCSSVKMSKYFLRSLLHIHASINLLYL